MAEQGVLLARLQQLSRQTDILLAAGVVGIVGVMVIPIPAALLDLLISVNITMAVLLVPSILFFSGAGMFI